MKKFLAFSILVLFILCGVMVAKSSGLFDKKDVSSVPVEDEADPSVAQVKEVADLPAPESQPAEEPDPGEPDSAEPFEEAEIPTPEYENEEPEEQVEIRDPLSEYDGILDVNPYVSGWLRIDGAGIDSPVVYTPKSQNYFVHRDLEGNYAESGTLFIAAIWREGYNNTLIYGHNMRDGSGFGTLGKYSSRAFAEKHKTFRFDTLYESREYELLGAFYSQIEEEELETKEDREQADKKVEEEGIAKKIEEEKQQEPSEESKPEEASEEAPSEEPEPPKIELTLKDLGLDEDLGNIDVYRMEKDEDMQNGVFRYYYFTDLTEKADYDYFVQNVKKDSIYDTGVDAEWGDELLTLSTCSYHVHNGRFVVVAKRVK